MTRSQFWEAVEELFGSVYGRSICTDLFISDFGANAVDALASGCEPIRVWQTLLREEGLDTEANLWPHRADKKK